MMRHLAGAISVVALLVSDPQSAKAQTAAYCRETGAVEFNGLSGQAGITLIGNGIVFESSAMNPFGQINDSALADAEPAKLAWSDFGGFQGGPFSSGAVVPFGTDPELLSVDLTSLGGSYVLPRLPINNPNQETHGFFVTCIPEPGSVFLTGMALLEVATARSRRGLSTAS
jgi:hypothetical protein